MVEKERFFTMEEYIGVKVTPKGGETTLPIEKLLSMLYKAWRQGVEGLVEFLIMGGTEQAEFYFPPSVAGKIDDIKEVMVLYNKVCQ